MASKLTLTEYSDSLGSQFNYYLDASLKVRTLSQHRPPIVARNLTAFPKKIIVRNLRLRCI